MAAISDSSALILYARIGRLSLLQQLFTTVFIPPAVYEEVVSSGSGRPGSFEVLDLPWTQQSPLTKTATLPVDVESLGRGELEAIARATDFGGLLPLLLDDRLARRVAQEQGLFVLGSARVPLLPKFRPK